MALNLFACSDHDLRTFPHDLTCFRLHLRFLGSQLAFVASAEVIGSYQFVLCHVLVWVGLQGSSSPVDRRPRLGRSRPFVDEPTLGDGPEDRQRCRGRHPAYQPDPAPSGAGQHDVIDGRRGNVGRRPVPRIPGATVQRATASVTGVCLLSGCEVVSLQMKVFVDLKEKKIWTSAWLHLPSFQMTWLFF